MGSPTGPKQLIDKGHEKGKPGPRPILLAFSAFAVLMCPGCAMSPSLPLFGAAFPDWLFCMIGGVVATIVIHAILARTKRTALLHPLALSYPGLAAIFSVLIWFALFYH